MAISETKLQSECARIVQQEVNCCLSSLIYTLSKGYGEATGELGELAEQAFELASPIEDYEVAASQEGWTISEHDDGGFFGRKTGEEEPLELDGDTKEEAARDLCEREGIDPYNNEVFEHWAVSQWLGDKLKARGEKIDDAFTGLVVWARTTTGQAISMDYVIRQIVSELYQD